MAEMRYFASNFAPKNWAYCAGQILPISSNTALFSLSGTIYGGDGQTTFALPDSRGRFLMSAGTGPGLSNYSLGEKGGYPTAQLTINNLPQHTHSVTSVNVSGGNISSKATEEVTSDSPAGLNYSTADGITPYTSGQTPDVTMAATPVNITSSNLTVMNSGGSQPFSIQDPYVAIPVVICLYGIYPSRN